MFRVKSLKDVKKEGPPSTFVRPVEEGGGSYSLFGEPSLPEKPRGSTRQARKKNMDEFLQELKARDAVRASGVGEVPAVLPVVDEAANYESTNLFVGNLASSVTEEKLREAFGAFGDIFSVKVMWPRSEDERRRNRNKGFVSFVRRLVAKTLPSLSFSFVPSFESFLREAECGPLSQVRREDAEEAKARMDDQPVDGIRVQVTWGKPLKDQPPQRPASVYSSSSERSLE
mmetsp:Transcript_30739/g.99079  ORF Transcript_30739/g.99079 Transcript_30739/m.99079 type:complete len:229 (-) Transcript_30739:1648-2334(-)